MGGQTCPSCWGSIRRRWSAYTSRVRQSGPAASGQTAATPLTYSLRRDDSEFVVFCFSKSERAEAFAKRFSGERLLTGSRGWPSKQADDPSALLRANANVSSVEAGHPHPDSADLCSAEGLSADGGRPVNADVVAMEVRDPNRVVPRGNGNPKSARLSRLVSGT